MNSIVKHPWQTRFPQFSETHESLEKLLSNGQLPESEYLEWASEHFELPVLQNNFFANLDLKKLLEKYPSTAWNNTFFPAAEGNGIVYIACIEPKEISIPYNHCCVLASHSSMSAAWAKCAPPVSQMPSTKSILFDPPPKTEALNLDFSQLDSSPAETPAAISAPTPPTPAAPEPLPSYLEITADIAPLENEHTAIPTPIASGPTSPTEPFLPHTSTTPAKEIPSHLANNAPVTLVKTTAPVAPVMNDISFTSTKTIMPFPDKTKDFTFVRTVFTEETILGASSKISEAQDPQDALIGAFKIMRDYFKKLMWCVRDNQGSVFPIACNSLWDFSEAAWVLPLDFKTPNPFRIAKLTALPYHGPVAPNAASDQFFKMWNNGKYPDQLTIVPVVLNEKVFSYLIGCDKGNHFQPEQSLEAMEKVCADLLSCFQKIHKEIKKPAA